MSFHIMTSSDHVKKTQYIKVSVINNVYTLFYHFFLYFIQNFYAIDPDYSSRIFRKNGENIKLGEVKLAEHAVLEKIQCALYCLLDNTCTQFSYHGDVVGSNCLLGSASSGEETQDGWTTFLGRK